MTVTEKRAELKRLLDACRSDKLGEFLGWLGGQAIQNPDHHPDWRGVYVGAIDTGLRPKELVDKDEATVKNRAFRTRNYVDEYYEKHGVLANIWLDLPLGGYVVRFGTGPRPKRGERKQTKTPILLPATSLWHRMITGQNARSALLIYSTPSIWKLENKRWVEDKRGLDTGSGEVIAAFHIAACTYHLNKMIEIRRSNDVNSSDLENSSTCFIYLGSSMNCGLLQALRARQPWNDLQLYHFHTVTKKRGEEGEIWKGQLGKRPSKRFPYKVKNPRSCEVDYALISFFQNPQNHQSIIAVQGISTIGTWAGAFYMTDDQHVAALRSEFEQRGIAFTNELPSFELLLRITLNDYRPETIEFVDLKIH